MKRRKRISFWNLWLVSIMGGILAGTVWANLLGGELLTRIGYFDGIPVHDDQKRLGTADGFTYG